MSELTLKASSSKGRALLLARSSGEKTTPSASTSRVTTRESPLKPSSASSRGRAMLLTNSARTSSSAAGTSLKPASNSSKGRAMLTPSISGPTSSSSSMSCISEKSEKSESSLDSLLDMESDFRCAASATNDNTVSSASHRQEKLYTAKICFLLDLTGSMEPQRDAVMNKIFDITDGISVTFPDVHIEMACVGYRDVDVNDSQRYEIIPFTSDAEAFSVALASCHCGGGGDEAEDVLGGMDMALKKLDWSGARIKVMFHIGDSPHHGLLFHDESAGGCNDSHPHLFQTPRPYTEILADYADNHIDYNFGLVNNPRNEIKTREMARLFAQSYNSYQSKKNEFGLMDLSDFSPDHLFDKVLAGLTGSIRSFMSRRK